MHFNVEIVVVFTNSYYQDQNQQMKLEMNQSHRMSKSQFLNWKIFYRIEITQVHWLLLRYEINWKFVFYYYIIILITK